jgi:hypothetical protein
MIDDSQLAEVKLAGQLLNNSIFLPFHSSTGHWDVVFVAIQMQESVDKIADKLGLPRGLKNLSLTDSFINANQKLCTERTVRIIKRDYVRSAVVFQKCFVDPADFVRIQESNTYCTFFFTEDADDYRLDNLA